MGNPLLGSNEGDHLLQGVKLYVCPFLIPAGNSFPEVVHAGIARISMIARLP